MANSTCSVPACGKKVNARGLCGKHYYDWRKDNLRTCDTCGGRINGRGRSKYCSDECRVCRILDCSEPLHPKGGRGLCLTHYKREQKGCRTETICESCGAELKKFSGKSIYCSDECKPRCAVDGCGNPYRYSNGYCARHGAIFARTGSPVSQHEWVPEADVYTCKFCGTEFAPIYGRRLHCSARCQGADSRYGGKVPVLSFNCVICDKRVKREWAEVFKARSDKKYCEDCARRKSRRHKSSASYLANRDGVMCGICAEPVDMELKYPNLMSGSVDHILAVALGGALTDESNLQLAHLRCNLIKQAREEYSLT